MEFGRYAEFLLCNIFVGACGCMRHDDRVWWARLFACVAHSAVMFVDNVLNVVEHRRHVDGDGELGMEDEALEFSHDFF